MNKIIGQERINPVTLILILSTGIRISHLTGLDADICADKARLWMELGVYHGQTLAAATCEPDKTK